MEFDSMQFKSVCTNSKLSDINKNPKKGYLHTVLFCEKKNIANLSKFPSYTYLTNLDSHNSDAADAGHAGARNEFFTECQYFLACSRSQLLLL